MNNTKLGRPLQAVKFRVRIVVEKDGLDFYAYCPDLKGVCATGESKREAFQNCVSATGQHLQVMLKNQLPISIGCVDEIVHETWLGTILRALRNRRSERKIVYSEIRELPQRTETDQPAPCVGRGASRTHSILN